MSKWVVDTCVIIDVLSGDSAFSTKSADAIDAKRAEGLVVAPITYVELAPSFLGDVAKQDMVLSDLGI
jgi:predicted nucleic acid-binding protein